MKNWLKWTLIIGLGFAFGVGIGTDGITQLEKLLLIVALLLLFVLLLFPTLYIAFWTQNMDKVEAYLERSKLKYPQYAALLDAVNGNFDGVERSIPLIRNKQARISMQVALLLERQQPEQARKLVEGVQVASRRNYCKALIAIMEDDLIQAEEHKTRIRNKVFQLIIDAEIAFNQSKLKEANQFGQLAIEQAGGMQKFILIRSLERQKSNPARHTYF